MMARSERMMLVSLLVTTCLVAAACPRCKASEEEVVASIDGLIPEDGSTMNLEGPGPYDIAAETTDQKVIIYGNNNTQYDEVHSFQLFLDNTQVDNDEGGTRVRTDATGYWERQAHGSGTLWGQNYLSTGHHTARATTQITAQRVQGVIVLWYKSSYEFL